MGLKITDRSAAFLRKTDNILDVVLNTAAIDIERMAKVKVPFMHGQLRSSISHFRRAPLKYAVIANKEYAAYQEHGERRDGSHVVRNYSKAGTGKEFLSGSGRTVGKDIGRRLKAAARLIK